MERICKRCKKILPIEQFIKAKDKPFGRGYRCVDCNRLNYRARRERNKETHRRKDRAYYEKHREEILEKRRLYLKENKVKVAARQKVKNAVFNGTLVRPKFCSKCNVDCWPDAHHEDYSKPLEVEWLCRKCHQIKHNGK